MPATIPKESLESYFEKFALERAAPKESEFNTFIYAPSHELAKRREETACLDEILKRERLRAVAKKEEFSKRWAQAAESLKNSDELINTLDFRYREILSLKDKSYKLIERQEELKRLKTSELSNLVGTKTKLVEVKEGVERRLDGYSGVETYLTSVIGASEGEFKSVRELLDRATLLLNTRDELLKRNEIAEKNLRARETKYSLSSQVGNTSGILMNNLISELGQDLESSKDVERKLEEDVAHVKATAAKRTRILGEVRAATYNLFVQTNRAMGRKSSTKIHSSDTVAQLDLIQRSLTELNKVREGILHAVKKIEAERNKELKKEESRNLWLKGKRQAFFIPKVRNKVRETRLLFGLSPEAEEEMNKEGSEERIFNKLTQEVSKDEKHEK